MTIILAIFAKLWWFLKRVFWFVTDNWKVVLPAIGVLIVVIFVYRACHKAPHLNEAQIQKAQQAIAVQDREQMKEVLVESEVQEKQINANLANAETEKLNALAEARKKAEQMTNQELADELERRAKE